MVSLFIEPKSSSLLMLLLKGSVPMIKASNIPSFDLVCKPVLGSIFTKLIPEGILNGIFCLLISVGYNFLA